MRSLPIHSVIISKLLVVHVVPIPRILHQTFSRYEKLPMPLKANCERIRDLNPDFDYRFYEDSDRINFIRTHYGADVLKVYNKIDPSYGAARADLFRYLCIYTCGGIYLDVKAEVKTPLSFVIQPDDDYILSQWDYSDGSPHARWGTHSELNGFPGGAFQQWHVFAAPHHPFLAAVIATVLERIDHFNAFRYWRNSWEAVIVTTGESPYTKAIMGLLDQYPHRIVQIERDLNVHYSIFTNNEGVKHHQKLYPTYNRLYMPLISQRWPLSWMWRTFAEMRKLVRKARLALN